MIHTFLDTVQPQSIDMHTAVVRILILGTDYYSINHLIREIHEY